MYVDCFDGHSTVKQCRHTVVWTVGFTISLQLTHIAMSKMHVCWRTYDFFFFSSSCCCSSKTFKMVGGWRLCAHVGYHDGSCNVDLINCGQYSVFEDEASGEH